MTEPPAPQRRGLLWSPEARNDRRAIDRDLVVPANTVCVTVFRMDEWVVPGHKTENNVHGFAKGRNCDPRCDHKVFIGLYLYSTRNGTGIAHPCGFGWVDG